MTINFTAAIADNLDVIIWSIRIIAVVQKTAKLMKVAQGVMVIARGVVMLKSELETLLTNIDPNLEIFIGVDGTVYKITGLSIDRTFRPQIMIIAEEKNVGIPTQSEIEAYERGINENNNA